MVTDRKTLLLTSNRKSGIECHLAYLQYSTPSKGQGQGHALFTANSFEMVMDTANINIAINYEDVRKGFRLTY